MDVRSVWNFVFRWLFGYGHLPARALIASFVIWLAAALTGTIYTRGQFAPNSDVILTSPEWQAASAAGCPLPAAQGFATARAGGCVMPLFLWTGPTVMPEGSWPAMRAAKDYETFSAPLYALDLFLPIVELGQVAAWAPSKDRGPWGKAGFFGRWMVELAGWLIAAVGAAVMTGLVGQARGVSAGVWCAMNAHPTGGVVPG